MRISYLGLNLAFLRTVCKVTPGLCKVTPVDGKVYRDRKVASFGREIMLLRCVTSPAAPFIQFAMCERASNTKKYLFSELV